MELKQKTWFERREFYLLPEKMRIFVKDADGEFENFIDYEEITSKQRKRTEQNAKVYYWAISFTVFTIVGAAVNFFVGEGTIKWVPLWAMAAVILGGFHFARRKRFLLVDLTTGKSIFFLLNHPSRAALEEFLAQMFLVRKKYLRENYGAINYENDRQNELAKFNWLLKENVITAKEFEVIKERLLASE